MYIKRVKFKFSCFIIKKKLDIEIVKLPKKLLLLQPVN